MNAPAAFKKVLSTVVALCVRLRWFLIGALVLVLLAMGGAYGWQRYQYKQSAAYAFEVLQRALTIGQLETLATGVDFRSLTTDLAQWILQERPETPHTADATAVAHLSDEIQQALRKALEQARSTGKPKPPGPQAPLEPLPDDAIPQIAATLSLQGGQQGVAVLRAEVKHRQADSTFVVSLLLEHKPHKGWVVTRIANAREIVRQFVETEQGIARQREEAFVERNRNAQRRMDAQVTVLSCTAHAKKLEKENTALLTVAVMGYNAGGAAIHNMNFDVQLTGNGVDILRHVNLAQRMLPGEHFTHTWNADIADTPEDAALLRAGTLQCVARPHSMVLSTGEWLYIEDKTP